MSEGLFYFFALTISPPLRFGPELCPAAEGARIFFALVGEPACRIFRFTTCGMRFVRG
jgi:hypothetical protein